ncbi:MAG TPA: Gfo/Idh/MocA family oxidoreductase [Parafilimonas sp.]|nr:Gfo/Idh/MocA family oxidoreductase [Parafilimonas sp.]
MSQRRKFIKQLGGSALLLGAGSLKNLAAKEQREKIIIAHQKNYSSNDMVRIAGIGMGIMGYNDVTDALKVPGVELAACCDLYDGRLAHAKELYGNNIFTTKHYEDILSRKDIDAVLVATSDNWHSRICIDAMKAGKAVYSEKPMVHQVSQGWDVINTHNETKKVMQVGSQRVSSIVFAKAKEMYEAGDIGKINSVEAVFNRQDALGAWQYTIPLDASPQTVDWNRYQEFAEKKVSYDPNRFFRWRNYREYGTGVAGDLFVHLLSGLHFITSSKGPEKIYSIAGLTYWKDGRNVPDVMTAVLKYPETPQHSEFQVTLRVNFVSGEGETGFTKITGTEGVMEMHDNGFTIKRHKMSKAPGIGGWDSLATFTNEMQKELLDAYNKKWSAEDQAEPKLSDITYAAPENYDEHIDHLTNFFNSVRTGAPVVEDPIFGLRAAGPCLLCNESYFQNKVMYWDADKIKIV